jgi:hypothetical protein
MRGADGPGCRHRQGCRGLRRYRKTIEIALEVEQLIYETNTFFNAANMTNNVSKT